MSKRREKGSWSSATYEKTLSAVRTRGGAVTHESELRAQQTRELHPLVDPKQFGVVRQSNSLFVPDGDQFILTFGVAMPVKTDIDTTGSMGRNVDIAFAVLPKVQNLLVQGPNAVLRRYHVRHTPG